MTTTFLEPDSANLDTTRRDEAPGAASFPAMEQRERDDCLPPVPLVHADLPGLGLARETSMGMTEEDTVSVLEVLAEMQRIIDRHLEKTGQAQTER